MGRRPIWSESTGRARSILERLPNHYHLGSANRTVTRFPPHSQEMIRARIAPSVRTKVTEAFHELTFDALSTVCRVQFTCGDVRLAHHFQQEVWHWVARFEAQYSCFVPDSLIGRINAAAGSRWVDVDAETEALFDLCEEMVNLTRGAFVPTALSLIRLWNWKSRPKAQPTATAVAGQSELVGWNKIQRRRGGIFLPHLGMCLDLGAIGKEYAVDRMLTLALERGNGDVLVGFGQDLGARPESPGNIRTPPTMGQGNW